MIKLSAVIITYNEERNIERCLKSLQGIADEIIVVDSFSTDNTERICVKYGVNFIKNPFEGHIQQKNFAANQAKYDYALSLDADETLSDKLKEEISKVKENPTFDGYIFNRLTNYCGKWIKHSGWYPDKKLRLWNRHKGKWGGVNPHDKYEMDSDANIGFLKGDLLHYSYYSITDHIVQVNKFTDIAAKELYAKNKRTSLFMTIVKSKWKFLRDYIFKAGFLDGYYGFIIAVISAHATFLKYTKARQLYRVKQKDTE